MKESLRGPKNGSRRGNEADGCARLPGSPPRYLSGYGGDPPLIHTGALARWKDALRRTRTVSTVCSVGEAVETANVAQRFGKPG